MTMTVLGVNAWMLAVAVAVRLVVVFLGHDHLQTRIELVAHHTSFLQAREAVFLVGHGHDVYADADYHQPPLVLALFRGCRVRDCDCVVFGVCCPASRGPAALRVALRRSSVCWFRWKTKCGRATANPAQI